jgi:transketolase
MSISYSGAPVTIVGTHSGVAIGEDGHSQMGLEDIAMMRVLPNMRVLQPCDERDTHQCMDEILKQSEPVYLRLTRQDVPECTPANYKFRFGEPNLVRDGTDMTLFTTGSLTSEGVKAVEVLKTKGISVRHVNVTSLKPLRKEAVLDYVRAGQWVITAEDHYTEGGLGGIMAELLSEHRPTRLHRIGVAGRFGQSGSPEDNYREYGLNHEALALRIQQLAQRI